QDAVHGKLQPEYPAAAGESCCAASWVCGVAGASSVALLRYQSTERGNYQRLRPWPSRPRHRMRPWLDPGFRQLSPSIRRLRNRKSVRGILRVAGKLNRQVKLQLFTDQFADRPLEGLDLNRELRLVALHGQFQ